MKPINSILMAGMAWLLLPVLTGSCTRRDTRGGTQVETVRGDTLYQGGWAHGSRNGYGVLSIGGKVCYEGAWKNGRRNGLGQAPDSLGRLIQGTWQADTLVQGVRTDSAGTYRGQFNRAIQAHGHGVWQGCDGSYYEGHWQHDHRQGQGFGVTAHHRIRTGEWRADRFLGERVKYTTERIYGIDISKYQHITGRHRYPIDWKQLRIVHLGSASKKVISGAVDYPVSFVYIKSTEGASVLNPYYKADYRAARAAGFRVGTYHFFSISSSAKAQAAYFLKKSYFRPGDFPPVLDVEPDNAQIAKIGGAEELFARIRTWMTIVQRHTGVRPVLYISQMFVNRYLPSAPDIKKNYDVWIARYGEYKPDVRLVYWQLCQDGRVRGIHGHVDINVFNGYTPVFREFLNTRRIK